MYRHKPKQQKVNTQISSLLTLNSTKYLIFQILWLIFTTERLQFFFVSRSKIRYKLSIISSQAK